MPSASIGSTSQGASMLIEMPESGTFEGKQAASLAPMSRQSGKWQGKERIQGGRAFLPSTCLLWSQRGAIPVSMQIRSAQSRGKIRRHHYDEPEILPSSSRRLCPMSADLGIGAHAGLRTFSAAGIAMTALSPPPARREAKAVV
jgi:hypothetical protein